MRPTFTVLTKFRFLAFKQRKPSWLDQVSTNTMLLLIGNLIKWALLLVVPTLAAENGLRASLRDGPAHGRALEGPVCTTEAFLCPYYSDWTPGSCPFIPNRCWCQGGYTLDPEGESCIPCVTDYSCPDKSSPKFPTWSSREKCTFSLADCSCQSEPDGTRLLQDHEVDACVPAEQCTKKYDCPANSVFDPYGESCTDDFETACRCDAGLLNDLVTGECVPPEECSTLCPPNSFLRSNKKTCNDGFMTSCQCELGFFADPETETCVATIEECTNSCPPNSTPLSWLRRCPIDVRSCTCDEGLARDIDTNTCIPGVEWCEKETGFQCPPHSTPKPFTGSRDSCAWSIYDCVCEDSFEIDSETETCVPKPPPCAYTGYSCPENSSYLGVLGCEWTFSYCACDSGFLRDTFAETCVSSLEECTGYTCPENSVFRDGDRCPWDIWDCQCAPGFVPDGDTDSCLPEETTCWSDYTCPDNSVPSDDANACPWGLYQCNCDAGFEKYWDNDACVPEGSFCWSSYTCPPNSTSDNSCCWGLWDCTCAPGFDKDWDNDACVPEGSICWSTYTCPPNSVPNAESNDCPWSAWQCECLEAYKRDWGTGACVPDVPRCWSSFECPANSVPKARTNGCAWSIFDCECAQGFRPDGDTNTCIPFEGVAPTPPPTDLPVASLCPCFSADDLSDIRTDVESFSEILNISGQRNAVFGDNGAGGFSFGVSAPEGYVFVEAIEAFALGDGTYPSYCAQKKLVCDGWDGKFQLGQAVPDSCEIVVNVVDNNFNDGFGDCKKLIIEAAIALSAPCYENEVDNRECVNGEIRS